MESTPDLPPQGMDLPDSQKNNVINSDPVGISADEIALYDRQIRLWGVQAQEKIRNARILLIKMKAVANEVAKNLVLAGVYSLTIIDDELVMESDLYAQFFISELDIGKNRAEAAAPRLTKLNPRVKIIVDKSDIREKTSEYFGSFDVVIATDLLPETLESVNLATRDRQKPFYAASAHGFYGFIFSDLIQHDYVVEREKSNRSTIIGIETLTRSIIDVQEKKMDDKDFELVTKRDVYSPWNSVSQKAGLPSEILKRKNRLKAVTPLISCLRALWEFTQAQGGRYPEVTIGDLKIFMAIATQKHKVLGLPDETLRSEIVRKFLQGLGSEIAPVTAILGGQLAQDVINVLGARQQPIQNMVIFDGDSMESPMYALHIESEIIKLREKSIKSENLKDQSKNEFLHEIIEL